jgi:hypothetical protein
VWPRFSSVNEHKHGPEAGVSDVIAVPFCSTGGDFNRLRCFHISVPRCLGDVPVLLAKCAPVAAVICFLWSKCLLRCCAV